MELILAHQTETQISVTCDSHLSHTFDLEPLLLKDEKILLENPVLYGQKLYEALFPLDTFAYRTLALMLEVTPGHILLVTTDSDLDAIPWEYIYGTDGFLVLDCYFMRGLPVEQRVVAPTFDTGLHIVAIPSNPLSHDVEPLNIDGEWMRLKEIIEALPYTITLERTRPPTMEQVRRLVANQRSRIIHFMGHGGQHESGAILLFEKDNGNLDPVTAKDFVRRVRGTVFLVTLNACVSATPGPTAFSNLAAALVQQKTPYALGMRLSIVDDDARAFSHEFYSDLARGVSVEEALYQARLTLAQSLRRWVVGVPVLYTALNAPATGFVRISGIPVVKEHLPPIEVSTLPRAEGIFQGRIDELKEIGTHLTGDTRPRLLTIHGAGGQGKTSLAREAVERFAYAWPGGIWATTLENLPTREIFVNDLARFLGIDTQSMTDSDAIEQQVLAQLNQHRTLIVLDNAETLIEAVKVNNEVAISLAQFIREQLPCPPVSLLATSRSYLGWNSEIGLDQDLQGLEPDEGAQLFLQSAPQRKEEIDLVQAKQLSSQVEGHPLSLHMLGGAFNESAISLAAFIKEYEAQLLQAENKYVGPEHRQRTLYASIDISVSYLDTELQALFSGLWIFHAPFLPETALAIFDPKNHNPEVENSPIHNHLHRLWLRSLLIRYIISLGKETLLFYHLLPTIRLYVEQKIEQAYERDTLLAQFGGAYLILAGDLFSTHDKNAKAIVIIQQTLDDFEKAIPYVDAEMKPYYLFWLGSILNSTGNPRKGLELLEKALELAQGHNRLIESQTLNTMGIIYQNTGQPHQALLLHEQALPLMLEGNGSSGVAATLNNMGHVYLHMGDPDVALQLYQHALPITREVEDYVGEATTLNNMGQVYQEIGNTEKALQLYQQALQLSREHADPSGEATPLNNIALIYQRMWNFEKALQLYQQALQLLRDVGDRTREAETLNNIALLYQETGHPREALQLYQQILPMMMEVENRTGEAAALNGLAYSLRNLHRYTESLEAYEQSIELARQTAHYTGEIASRVDLSILLYEDLDLPQEAIIHLKQAIAMLQKMGLTQDAAGHTIEDLFNLLQVMRAGAPDTAQTDGSEDEASDPYIFLIHNTLVVLGPKQEKQKEWHDTLLELKNLATQDGEDKLAALLTAVIDLLNAGGNPEGLGTNLEGKQAQVWQELVAHLTSK